MNLLRIPHVAAVLICLAVVTLGATVLAEAGLVSTSFVKTLGKTLCLCLVAVAMDLVWGYTGILSLGHMAFFGIGGYSIGMWLMRARTEGIVAAQLDRAALPPTPAEIDQAAAVQIFGVVGSDEFPWMWAFSDILAVQLLAVVAVPGLLALIFGWLAFRSRVTGVYLSILTQAGTLASKTTVDCVATTGCRAYKTSPALMTFHKAHCRCGSCGLPPPPWR